MAGKMYRRKKKRIMTALLLFICVALTTMVVMDRMLMYLPNDEGAIPLIPDVTAADGELPDGETDAEAEAPVSEIGGEDTAAEETAGTKPEDPESEYRDVHQDKVLEGLTTSDDNIVWENQTNVEIFRVSYENESGEVTVQSSDGEKVIAPGTSNSYTFKLKNTGNVAIDYNITMESNMTSSSAMIPVESRISRHDGKWLMGDEKTYVSMEEFYAIDTGTVGAGRFIYYTLDWMWPFEGDDEADTMLGNLSLEEDFTFSIVLKSEAELSGNPEDEGGILTPQTGDNYKTVLWASMCGVSFMAILFLVLNRDEEEEEVRVEEKR